MRTTRGGSAVKAGGDRRDGDFLFYRAGHRAGMMISFSIARGWRGEGGRGSHGADRRGEAKFCRTKSMYIYLYD